MIEVRKSKDRGHVDHGWLNTYHTFSFADYHDRNHMGFRSLRVINEDFVKQGEGFGTHGHKDMEIITYVLEGAVAHKDSMGNGSTIKPGEVQYMSAGTGVTHSEFNPLPDQALHLLQIWILPREKNLKPNYDQRHFGPETRLNQLKQVVAGFESHGAEKDAIRIQQDADLYASLLEKDKTLTFKPKAGRHLWLQVARGAIELGAADLNDTKKLSQGDGAAVSDENEIRIKSLEMGSEFLLFDLS